MSQPWREVLIDVEPRGKEFRLGIDEDATPADVLNVIENRCREEGIDIQQWAKKQVGNDFQFVLLRKAQGNAILAPGVPMSEVMPEIQNNEKFKLGTQPVVGALPTTIFNRRIAGLIDEFYSSDLSEIYQQEGWPAKNVKRENGQWQHEDFSVSMIDSHPDGAYKTLAVQLENIPGVIAVKNGRQMELSYSHHFRFCLPRAYPQGLSQIRIVNHTPLFHPRIVGTHHHACYAVNGEVDRILVDILFNVLLRPETVRPPSQFKDGDWGLDGGKMHWYIQAGPDSVYAYLKDQWAQRQKSLQATVKDAAPTKRAARVKIYD